MPRCASQSLRQRTMSKGRPSRQWSCERKIRHVSEPPPNGHVRYYSCKFCGGWHATRQPPKLKESGKTMSYAAAKREALRRAGALAEVPDGWKPAETAPMNGSMIRTPRGAIMRWLKYKPASEEAIAGIEGRWQVWRSGLAVWMNAVSAPTCWRGHSGNLPGTPKR